MMLDIKVKFWNPLILPPESLFKPKKSPVRASIGLTGSLLFCLIVLSSRLRVLMKAVKHLVLVGFVFGFGFICIQGFTNRIQADIETKIWQLEEQYWEYWVKGDIDGYLALLHEDFLGWPSSLISPAGKRTAREFVENYLAQTKPIAFGIKSGAMSVISNTAIVHYTVFWKDEKGHQIGDAYRITHTWIEQDGTWKVMGGMSSPHIDAMTDLTKTAQKEEVPVLIKPYLGQKPPGMKPEIFAPGIVSTEIGELNTIVSPTGEEIYFCRSSRSGPTAIMVVKKESGKWTNPQVVSFSGTFSDMDPSMSADGLRIFFGSTRPSGKLNAEGCDIWIVDRTALSADWSEPVNVGEPVNTEKNENYPTTTEFGTLYFQSAGHGGYGGLDIFRSEFRNGKYAEPMNLGTTINSEYNDFDAFITRDESCLIFSSNGRPEGVGSGDLYISFRKKDGNWIKAQNMGEIINSTSMEYCPKVSPDGKYLFFTSGRSGNGDIYWVDAKIIEKFRSF
jgi:hypothetical protein